MSSSTLGILELTGVASSSSSSSSKTPSTFWSSGYEISKGGGTKSGKKWSIGSSGSGGGGSNLTGGRNPTSVARSKSSAFPFGASDGRNVVVASLGVESSSESVCARRASESAAKFDDGSFSKDGISSGWLHLGHKILLPEKLSSALKRAWQFGQLKLCFISISRLRPPLSVKSACVQGGS